MQYEVQVQGGSSCGGAYVKVRGRERAVGIDRQLLLLSLLTPVDSSPATSCCCYGNRAFL